jgi:transcriptional regulator with XRE-family HTH domain
MITSNQIFIIGNNMSRTRDNKIEKVIGSKIYDLRLGEGWSRQQLTKHIGVTSQQIAKYEDGSNRISISTLILVAKAFKVPISYFIDGYDRMIDIEPKTQHQRMCIEVSRNFMKLQNPKHQQAVNSMLKLLVAGQ